MNDMLSKIATTREYLKSPFIRHFERSREKTCMDFQYISTPLNVTF